MDKASDPRIHGKADAKRLVIVVLSIFIIGMCLMNYITIISKRSVGYTLNFSNTVADIKHAAGIHKPMYIR